MTDKIEVITKQLLEEIGEDPFREGLLKTPKRVSQAWAFFSKGYNEDLNKIINIAVIAKNTMLSVRI